MRQRLEEKKNQTNSALKIQSYYRIMFAKIKVKQLRKEFWMVELRQATCKIQSVWRGNLASKLAKCKYEEKRLLYEMREMASIRIQTFARSNKAR